MKREVFWKNPGYRKRPSLKKDISCDYLIVGGGITRVSLAYFLATGGVKNIVLIEKKLIGNGATGRSAGILTLKGELDLCEALAYFGKKKGLQYWKANQEALAMIKHIVRKEKIRCEFEQQHTILGGQHEGDHAHVLREFRTEKKVEPTSRFLTGAALQKEVNTSIFACALLSRYHAISVNPLKHVQSLSYVIQRYGVAVYEHTPLLALKKDTAITPHARIRFKNVILAVDSALPHAKIKRNESTIIITEPLTKRQLRETRFIHKKVLWDAEDEYHYLKITKDNRILLGFGDKLIPTHHIKKLPLHKHHFSSTQLFLRELFPYLRVKTAYAWSGYFGITKHRLPVVTQQGTKIVVGGAGSQVVCVMASQYIADKLLRKPSRLDGILKPIM